MGIRVTYTITTDNILQQYCKKNKYSFHSVLVNVRQKTVPKNKLLSYTTILMCKNVQSGREVTAHPDNTHLRLSLSLHSTQYNLKWQFGNSVQDSAYAICRSHRI